jgi:hypothetical protein
MKVMTARLRGASANQRGGPSERGSRPAAKSPNPQPVHHRVPIQASRAAEATTAPPRMFDCVHYDSCLDKAVKQGWPSWTCELCQAFVAAPSERLAHDVAGLLQIWSEATGESVIDGPGVTGQRPRQHIRGISR